MKAPYDKETEIVRLSLAENKSYIVFGICSFNSGSAYLYKETGNMSNSSITISGNADKYESIYRVRTIGDSGGGALTMCVVQNTKSGVYAKLTTYCYYKSSSGYLEVGGKIIAIPIALS